jgi:2-haloacid dehalogenase
MKLPAIIFDIGGVFLKWDPRNLYRELFDGDSQAMERFLAEIDFFGWNLEQDKGRPFAEAVEVLCEQFPQYCHLIRAYSERYEDTILGTIERSVEILRELKQAGYPLYALSNWSAETYPKVRPKYAFFEWFDDILLSGEVKLIKPDERIYTLFLERIGRRSDECLFIDDSEGNVVVARQLGFKAIHFVSPEQLRGELEQMGVLSREGDLTPSYPPSRIGKGEAAKPRGLGKI